MSAPSDEVRDAALRAVPLQVNREHEDRPSGCACGTVFGDGIDRRWHLMNQSVSATVAFVLASDEFQQIVDQATARGVQEGGERVAGMIWDALVDTYPDALRVAYDVITAKERP